MTDGVTSFQTEALFARRRRAANATAPDIRTASAIRPQVLSPGVSGMGGVTSPVTRLLFLGSGACNA